MSPAVRRTTTTAITPGAAYNRFETLLLVHAVYQVAWSLFDAVFLGGNVGAPTPELYIIGLVFNFVLWQLAQWQTKWGWRIPFWLGVLSIVSGVLTLVGSVVAPEAAFVRASAGQSLYPLPVLVTLAFQVAIVRAGWEGRRIAFGSGSRSSGGSGSSERSGGSTPIDEALAQSTSSDRTSAGRPNTAATRGRASRSDPDGATSVSTETEPVESDAGASSDDAAGGAGTADDGGVGTGDAGEDGDAGKDDDADDDGAGEDGAVDEELDEAIAALSTGPVEPDHVRQFGSELDGRGVTDRAAAMLDDLASADDPDVRVAVCDVCGDLDDERARDVLRSLRIDTDNQVAEAAMAELRDG